MKRCHLSCRKSSIREVSVNVSASCAHLPTGEAVKSPLTRVEILWLVGWLHGQRLHFPHLTGLQEYRGNGMEVAVTRECDEEVKE